MLSFNFTFHSNIVFGLLRALVDAYPDKLIVIKVFAPWCKACKAVATKFIGIAKDKKYDGLPIVWAEMTVSGNKDYIKGIGVLALPSMLFYAGSDGLIENFPCGPSKIPILKQKLMQFVNNYVDPKTKELKLSMKPSETITEDKPCIERNVTVNADDLTALTIDGITVSKDAIENLRSIPFFKDFDEETFAETLSKAKLKTWEEGDIIMKEGKSGRSFYVILTGSVEVLVKTAGDPLSMPGNYLGTVINRLFKNEYFGERALITRERRAATVRATGKTRCFVFDKDDIPESSVLSGKGTATAERLEEVNDKYGVELSDIDIIQVRKQVEDSKLGSQIRGSVNSPGVIEGVDTPERVSDQTPSFKASEGAIFNLLQRFRLVKHAARCFDYIIQTRPSWSEGSTRRRSMLVKRLTDSQRQEFEDVFNLIDESNDNVISLLELKRVMDSIGEAKDEEELETLVTTGHTTLDGSQIMTHEDFMGIMAETEFYHLFKDTFASLDIHNSGFVKAEKLDRVLCGMRDLISDDRKSVIDVDDKDMMIDYEQFSRMLLGGSLSSQSIEVEEEAVSV